jgi:hypothetical protein
MHHLEVYGDNIIMKTQQSSSLIADLEETFANLWRIHIKLNPEKSTFGLSRGQLLGYIITKHGIEANADKILTIAQIGQVNNVKYIQQFMGCLVALSCFMS